MYCFGPFARSKNIKVAHCPSNINQKAGAVQKPKTLDEVTFVRWGPSLWKKLFGYFYFKICHIYGAIPPVEQKNLT